MDNLVLANLVARPIRSLSSVIGIALGVVLILVTVGLARGMLLSSGQREGSVKATCRPSSCSCRRTGWARASR